MRSWDKLGKVYVATLMGLHVILFGCGVFALAAVLQRRSGYEQIAGTFLAACFGVLFPSLLMKGDTAEQMPAFNRAPATLKYSLAAVLVACAGLLLTILIGNFAFDLFAVASECLVLVFLFASFVLLYADLAPTESDLARWKRGLVRSTLACVSTVAYFAYLYWKPAH